MKLNKDRCSRLLLRVKELVNFLFKQEVLNRKKKLLLTEIQYLSVQLELKLSELKDMEYTDDYL
jgi:hypothetical protein